MANGREMLMAARGAMMGGGAKPYDAEIEWLGFNLEQYAVAYYYYRDDTIVRLGFINTSNEGQARYIFSASNLPQTFYASSTGYYGVHSGSWSARYIYSQTINETLGIFTEATIDNVNHCAYMNNGKRYEISQIISKESKIFIGSIEGKKEFFKGKILSVSSQYFDFIPVRIGNVGYFYDRKNPTGGPFGNGLYGNEGRGSFTLGPDKI